MTKITNLNDFKRSIKWFDIKNYDCIRALSIEEIKSQIFYRWEFLGDLENCNTHEEDNGFSLIERNWDKLNKGEVVLSEGEMTFDWSKSYLARTQAIHGLSSPAVYSHISSLINRGERRFNLRTVSVDVAVTSPLAMSVLPICS